MMDRRRALMAQGESDVLFEWKPSDGIDMFTFWSSGTPRYELRSDALRLFPGDASWHGTLVLLKNRPTWDGDFTIEIKAKSISTIYNCEFVTSARVIGGTNVLFSFNPCDKSIKLTAQTTETKSVASIADPATVTLKINRTSGTATATITGQNPMTGSIPASPHTTSFYVVSFAGTNTAAHCDVTSIKITKGVST